MKNYNEVIIVNFFDLMSEHKKQSAHFLNSVCSPIFVVPELSDNFF